MLLHVVQLALFREKLTKNEKLVQVCETKPCCCTHLCLSCAFQTACKHYFVIPFTVAKWQDRKKNAGENNFRVPHTHRVAEAFP
jgi:hypothetical protein